VNYAYSVATLNEIETVYEMVAGQYTPEARIIADVLKNEIARRKAAGRRSTSPFDRKEQNRLAQAKWRQNKAKKKVD